MPAQLRGAALRRRSSTALVDFLLEATEEGQYGRRRPRRTHESSTPLPAAAAAAGLRRFTGARLAARALVDAARLGVFATLLVIGVRAALGYDPLCSRPSGSSRGR